MLIIYVVIILLECLQAAFLYDEDDPVFKDDPIFKPSLVDEPEILLTGMPSLAEEESLILKPIVPPIDELQFEPIVTGTKDKEKITVLRNIDCDSFAMYAMNCTFEAALMYNSSKKSPPMPSKVNEWCKAIRFLTNCAVDWNSDCRDVTESHFNEESIRGHMHVITNICDDEWFLSRYDVLPICIEGATDAWEACYTLFKTLVDEQKNTTHEWTHFDTHFQMCCARAQFRRCTLDTLFSMPDQCLYEQAVTLQKFSVIVSEGDVFQDCDANMMYSNCPGGDPRPSGRSLAKLMNAETFKASRTPSDTRNHVSVLCVVFLNLLSGLI